MARDTKPSKNNKVINGIANKDELGRWLFKAADILRGMVSPENYYRFIEPLLFFKRLSDSFMIEYEKNLEKYGDEEIARDPMHYDFVLPDGCSWEDVRNAGTNVGQKVNDTLEEIARVNPAIDRVINRTDYNNENTLSESKLIELIEYFSQRNLANMYVPPDVLGDAYEYMLKQFNEEAPKKAGEFYTPREVIKVLVGCLAPEEGMSIYDPCLGSAGMLIESSFYLRDKDKDPSTLFLYGQEINPDAWARAKMNLFLHGIEAFVEQGDTFQNPKFLVDDKLQTFDIVLANPMWNQKGFKSYMEKDQLGRFEYGVVNNSSADWGWIQHMLASLEDTGRMGIVLDQGALFRSGKERAVRKAIMEKEDYIEAVVALPDNLFTNTTAPGCLIFLNKAKPEERKNKVLFIYAAEEYVKLSNMNQLNEDYIRKIIDTFHDYIDSEKYSRIVELSEIKENDYNLSVTRYVDIFDAPEPIDVKKVWEEIKEIEEERQQSIEKIQHYLKELYYEK